MNFNKLLSELKRRNVFKVATAYAVTSWLIIQIIVAVEKPLSLPDALDTIVIWTLLIGFPVTLIIAWVYEWTNKGLQKTAAVDNEASITSTTSKKLNRIIISSLSLVVILLLVERIFFASDLFDTKKPSIAILPFASQSTDDQDISLAEGLSAEVISEMGRIEGLKVIAQTSSFRFTKVSNSDTDIANELGVRHLLTAKVSRRGTGIVVEAKLLDAEEGSVLWTDKIERTLENLFDIQATIIRGITKVLGVKLLPQEVAVLNNQPTDNPLAYELYLQTRRNLSSNGDEVRLEIELLKQALEMDSTFAKAHATLAIAYNRLNQNANFSYEQMIEKMEHHVTKAFEYGEEEPMAFRARSWLTEAKFAEGPDRLKSAEEDLVKTVSLAPNNALAFNDLQINLRNQNRVIEADSILLVAWDLDPLNEAITHNVAGLFSNSGDKQKAVELLEKAIKDHPHFAPLRTQLISIVLLEPYGRPDEAFKLTFEALKEFPNDVGLLERIVELSKDLDLTPLINKYMNQFQLLYPENFNMMMELIHTKTYNEEFDFILNFANQMEVRFKNNESDALKKAFASQRSIVSLKQDNHLKAKKIIEDGFPEIFDLDFDFEQILDENMHGDISTAFLNYSIALRKEGKRDSSRMYANKIVQHDAYHDSIQEARELKSTNLLDEILSDQSGVSTTRLFSRSIYAALIGNMDEMISTLEELYFDRKAYGYAWGHLNTRTYFEMYEGNIKYDAFKAKIREDVHQKRAIVIEYLKEQGEWDADWDSALD